METEHDVAIHEEGCPAEDHSTATPSAPSRSLRILGVFSLLAWAMLVLGCLFQPTAFNFDIKVYISYSLTVFSGFYLACGNARWWARWLLASLIVLLILAAHDGSERVEGTTYFGVLAMIAAGFTYASRMIISAIRGESNPLQRFTIFGLMVVTAITAVCLVALNRLLLSEGEPSIVLLVVILIGLGFALMAQCVPAWTCNKRQAVTVVAIALVLAFLTSLILHQVFYYVDNTAPSFYDVLLPIWMITGFMWLVLYPLWFGFYALGWRLIDPSWKFGPRYQTESPARIEEKAVDVLMED